MNESITIRQAKIYDVPAISRIVQDSFDTPWSADEITKDVTHQSGGLYVVAAADGDECVGFAEMKSVAGEAQIYNIAVDPEARGLGIGEALMSHLIDRALAEGSKVVNLEVRAGNTEAIGLYNKLGFREVGRRKGYYKMKNGREDAVLMDLDLRREVADKNESKETSPDSSEIVIDVEVV